MIKWYQITVEFNKIPPGVLVNFHYQLEKENICISPNVRLAGHLKAAHLETLKLAEEFMNKCLPIFQKRYDEGVSLKIMECCSSSNSKRHVNKIANDSVLVRNWLAQNRMNTITR